MWRTWGVQVILMCTDVETQACSTHKTHCLEKKDLLEKSQTTGVFKGPFLELVLCQVFKTQVTPRPAIC